MAAAIDGRGTRFVVSQAQPLFKPDPKPVGWLYDAAPDGVEDDFGCVVQIEFLHEIRPVGLDR